MFLPVEPIAVTIYTRHVPTKQQETEGITILSDVDQKGEGVAISRGGAPQGKVWSVIKGKRLLLLDVKCWLLSDEGSIFIIVPELIVRG